MVAPHSMDAPTVDPLALSDGPIVNVTGSGGDYSSEQLVGNRTWGAPTTIWDFRAPDGTTFFSPGDVIGAAGSDGTAAVVWSLATGGSQILRAAVETTGGAWGPASTLSTTPGSQASSAYQIVGDSYGGFTVVAALRSRLAAYTLRSNTDSWTTQSVLPSFSDEDPFDVVAGPGGQTAVVFERSAAGAGQVLMTIQQTPGGAWSKPVTLTRDAVPDKNDFTTGVLPNDENDDFAATATRRRVVVTWVTATGEDLGSAAVRW